MDSAVASRRAPVRHKSQKKRELVISAAQNLLSTFSPDEVNVSMIAKESGVTRTTIYDYFGSSESVYREIVKRYVDGAVDFVDSEIPSRNVSINDFIDITIERSCEYYNKFPPKGMKFLAKTYLEQHVSDPEFFYSISSRLNASIPALKKIDDLTDSETFANMFAVASSLMTISIVRHGVITATAEKNAKLAAKGYLSMVIDLLENIPLLGDR